MKLTEKQTHDLRVGAKLASSLPEIEEAITRMQEQTMGRVFGHIRGATLTPEMALSYWMEMHSYTRLLKGFQTSAALADGVIETTRRQFDGEKETA
jgi:hypothetical protein